MCTGIQNPYRFVTSGKNAASIEWHTSEKIMLKISNVIQYFRDKGILTNAVTVSWYLGGFYFKKQTER